jgi:hypothetical protein
MSMVSVKERFLPVKSECQNHTDYSPFRRSVYLHFKLCIFELFFEMLWILPWYIDANLLSNLQLNVVLIQCLERRLLVGQTTETELVLWIDDCQVLWSCIRRVNTQQGLVPMLQLHQQINVYSVLRLHSVMPIGAMFHY